MNGERAHYMLEDAKFVGKYRLADYARYRLYSYPGRYEGEGSLYIRKEVEVSNARDTQSVYAYVYNESVDRCELMREPWNSKDTDYVWYAAYGSNLSNERFLNYIEGGVYRLTGKYCDGCSDKSRWIDECIKSFTYTVGTMLLLHRHSGSRKIDEPPYGSCRKR